MAQKREYIVYKHTCPNGKVYIGITCQPIAKRFSNGYGYKRQTHFYNAILKYGWDNIKHEIMFDGLTKEYAEQKEIELISAYKSNDKKHGYNVANGGCTIGTMSEETKRKISDAEKGRTIPSMMEAERQLNISNSKICAVCKGKRMTAGGYVWRYA